MVLISFKMSFNLNVFIEKVKSLKLCFGKSSDISINTCCKRKNYVKMCKINVSFNLTKPV